MTAATQPVFAARPMSEVLSGHVERLIELYAGWSGYTPTRVQIQLFGDGSFCFVLPSPMWVPFKFCCLQCGF